MIDYKCFVIFNPVFEECLTIYIVIFYQWFSVVWHGNMLLFCSLLQSYILCSKLYVVLVFSRYIVLLEKEKWFTIWDGGNLISFSWSIRYCVKFIFFSSLSISRSIVWAWFLSHDQSAVVWLDFILTIRVIILFSNFWFHIKCYYVTEKIINQDGACQL